MKSVNKLLCIAAVATILSALVLALSAPPALAAERVDLYPSEGEISDRIYVDGSGFWRSTKTWEYEIHIIFSSDEAIVDKHRISDLHSYKEVKVKATDDHGEIHAYFNVPLNLRDGDVWETVHSGTYYIYTASSLDGTIKSKNEFTVIQAEIALTTAKGAVGTKVGITGNDFASRDSITVKYDAEEIDVESDTKRPDGYGRFSLAIVIPESIAGRHTITVDTGAKEAEAYFTVEPEITVTPANGVPGGEVTVEGTGFGRWVPVTIRLAGSEVATGRADVYGSFQANFILASKSPGTYEIEATDRYDNKDTVAFPVAARISLSQKTGNVGTEVTISGTGFTPAAMITVTYSTEPIVSVASTADADGKFSATFAVPRSTNGEHTVAATDGSNTATITFSMESTPPPAPEPLLPLDGTRAKSEAHLDWDDVEDPSLPVAYILQIATNDEFTNDSIALEKTDIARSEYTLTKEEKLKSTKKGAPYYWRLRAVDGAGNYSGWTSPASFRVGFTIELADWVLYSLFGISGLLLLFIGYLLSNSLGKRNE